jgi:hypothetical protein
MEDFLKELGFESEQEMHKLVSGADLSTPEKLADFIKWK